MKGPTVASAATSQPVRYEWTTVARSPTLESIRVVIGPTAAPDPMLVAPRSVVPGAIVASGAISTSASIQVALGSSIVTPARMCAVRIRRLASSAAREVGAVVHAEVDAGIGGAVRGDAQAGFPEQGEDVAEVVLALGVVVVDPPEGVGERPRRERVGAGVDLLDRELLRSGVALRLRLDDPLDLVALPPRMIRP